MPPSSTAAVAPKKSITKTTTTTTTTVTAPVASRQEARTTTHFRFHSWVSLLVLSVVAMIAILDITKNKRRNFQEKWSLAMACSSLSVAFLACVGHAVYSLRERFVSSIWELLLAMIAAGVWIFALPPITTTNEGLAVDPNFQIDNANLYFAAWGSFLFALFLLASVGNERGVSAARDAFARRWMWLVISSLIVMAACSRMFESVCQNNQYSLEGEFCKELKMGIALSVISAIIACIMTLLLWFTPNIIPTELVGLFFCLCLLAIWGILIAFLTFDRGPGAAAGNIFFGTWLSGILALDLGVCYASVWM